MWIFPGYRITYYITFVYISSDSFPTTHGKFALIVAALFIKVGSSDDIPFDGWTISMMD